MMTVSTIIATYQYNSSSRTNRDELAVSDIHGVTAIHGDSNRSETDPVIEFFSIDDDLLRSKRNAQISLLSC